MMTFLRKMFRKDLPAPSHPVLTFNIEMAPAEQLLVNLATKYEAQIVVRVRFGNGSDIARNINQQLGRFPAEITGMVPASQPQPPPRPE